MHQPFDIVRGIANGSKHATTRSTHAVPFTAGADWARPPAYYDVGFYDVSPHDDAIGGREVPHEGGSHDLFAAIQATLTAFLAAYPVELRTDSGDAGPS